DEIRNYIPPSSRQGQMPRLLHTLEKAEPRARTDYAKPFIHFQQFLFRRGIVAVISDFYADPDLIIKTMLSNLVERSREIGILKAIGWTGRDINRQLMGEALVQSLAGGLLGILIGYAVSYCMGFLSIPTSTPWQVNLMPALAKNTPGAIATTVRLPVSVSIELITAALVISVMTGILASLFMARRTARMKPMEILRKL
ncbi:MAG TPA: ABC transporter permease, partial [Deltaproteobacteria bacterium]|nr:ABC transporter permease [Deltaproteobacteria bacterium]